MGLLAEQMRQSQPNEIGGSMRLRAHRTLKFAFAMAVATTLSACATSPVMQPFSTDGCSLFPDRSLLSRADWCSCCVVHDLAYWRGGTADERLKADQEFKSCVLAASGRQELADLMFAGVRAGGGPYFFTPYRWGYGWSFGRLYRPLSERDEAQAASLRAKYIASNPALSCTKDAT